MQKHNLRSFFAIFSLTVVGTAQASFITIPDSGVTNTLACNGTGADAACTSALASAVDEALGQFENQLNASAGTGTLSLDSYFGGLGNSTVLAGSGLGAAYYNNFDYFLVGGGMGVGGALTDGTSIFDLAKSTGSGDSLQSKIAGFGAGASITLGARAGLIFKSPILWGLVDPSRLKGYVGFFFFPVSFDTIKANISSFSAIGQYQLIQPISMGLGALKWNGVNVSSGLRYARMSIDATYSQTPTQTESLDLGSGVSLPITFSAPVEVALDVKSSSVTIPFEASTSVRLGYVISLMMGTAFDLNMGSTSGGVTASDETIDITPGDLSGAPGGSVTGAATAGYEVNADFASGSGRPTFLNWRAFGGFQFEFGVGGLFVTVQKAILKPQYGVNLGLNLFY